ncbi:MAG: hypothetical protein EZS28_049080, partial [Streblomastix strix]
MSHADLATTQRQIGIRQLTIGQSVANGQRNLIEENVFLNVQPPYRCAMQTTAQIINYLLLGINTKLNNRLNNHQFHRRPAENFQSLIPQQGADSEGSQTQRQNTITNNSHTVMEIDMKSERRDINHPPPEAKINQASFNRQKDYWATKSNLLKYIGKPGANQHHPGYGERQIEVQEAILRHIRGETISIADQRKFWKELDADLKLDAIRLQSPVS